MFIRVPSLLLLVVVIAVGGALAPPAASAGTYSQYVCARPDGSSAPADRWSALGSPGTARLCGEGGPAMRAELPLPREAGATTALSWSPPPNVSLEAARLHRTVRAVDSRTGGTPVYRINSPGLEYDGRSVREQCHVRNGCRGLDGTVDVTGLSGGPLHVLLVCQDAACEAADGAEAAGPMSATVHSAVLTLRDDVAPLVHHGVEGSDGQVAQGIVRIRYIATDDGAGVYRHRVLVDGRTVSEGIADANGGRCADTVAGDGGARGFDYAVPCAARVDGEAELDTSLVTPGDHQVEVHVEDAAGNVAVAYRARREFRRTFTDGIEGLENPVGALEGLVYNGERADGAVLDAYFERKRRGRQRGFPGLRVVPFFEHPVAVARLRAQGGGVFGARLVVAVRERGPNAVFRAVRTLTTDRAGYVRYRLPARTSHDVRFAYFPTSRSERFEGSRIVSARVRALVRLGPSELRLRRGRTARLTGRVAHGAPAAGLPVTIEGRTASGRWRAVGTTRAAGRRGGFELAYRVPRRGGVPSALRAVVAAWPDEERVSGRSAPVRLRLRR